MTDHANGATGPNGLAGADDRLVALTLAEKVDPAHTALLVIDVQNDYNHDDGYSARRYTRTGGSFEVNASRHRSLPASNAGAA